MGTNELVGRQRRVAYLMSWFPAVTETFILNEILALERAGMRVEVFPLFGAHTQLLHPGGLALVQRTRYTFFLSWAFLRAQLYWLVHAPRRYLAAWAGALRGNLASPRFLLAALVVVPKAALIALRMKGLHVEHVHAHWATHPTLAALVIETLTGIPYSFTCHAHDLYVDRTMLRQKAERARFIATVSHFNRRLLASECGEAVARKVVVVRCGVDPSVFRPRPSRRPRRAPFTWVCVASLRPYKGHRHLVAALARLRAQGHDFRCLLVGEGPEREALAAQVARAGLQGRVQLLGAQPRERVQALLQAADGAVLPSIVAPDGQMEGVPVFLMEALACALPTVATRLSGIPELIEDGLSGVLVPPADSEALAHALARLMASAPLRERLGAAGRAAVLREFTLERNTTLLREMLVDASPEPWLPQERTAPAVLSLPQPAPRALQRRSRRSRERQPG